MHHTCPQADARAHLQAQATPYCPSSNASVSPYGTHDKSPHDHHQPAGSLLRIPPDVGWCGTLRVVWCMCRGEGYTGRYIWIGGGRLTTVLCAVRGSMSCICFCEFRGRHTCTASHLFVYTDQRPRHSVAVSCEQLAQPRPEHPRGAPTTDPQRCGVVQSLHCSHIATHAHTPTQTHGRRWGAPIYMHACMLSVVAVSHVLCTLNRMCMGHNPTHGTVSTFNPYES